MLWRVLTYSCRLTGGGFQIRCNKIMRFVYDMLALLESSFAVVADANVVAGAFVVGVMGGEDC